MNRSFLPACLTGALFIFGSAALSAEEATPAEADSAFPAQTAESPSVSTPAPALSDPLLQDAARHLENGDWREARDRAKKVLDRDKKSSDAWVILGRAYAQTGRHKKAIRRFKKALKYDPHNAAAYYWRGRSFEAIGKIDEAANEYQAAFRADPKMDAARSDWKRIRDHVTVTE
jgi:Tfp pilus assembly protein PilF